MVCCAPGGSTPQTYDKAVYVEWSSPRLITRTAHSMGSVTPSASDWGGVLLSMSSTRIDFVPVGSCWYGYVVEENVLVGARSDGGNGVISIGSSDMLEAI